MYGFGEKSLDKDWCPRLNLDISSLFVVLALLVGENRAEVLCVARACLEPKWEIGLEDIVACPEMGVGLHMGRWLWRLIGAGGRELQPLVVWSTSNPKSMHLPKVREG